jgi:sulfoxide reductase heme-binding subunit YedZ
VGVVGHGRRRGRTRLVRHYLPFTTLTLLATLGLAGLVDSPAWAYRYSLATAFASLAFFAASLAIGPIGLLSRGRPLPLSTDLRRDLGVLAGVVGLVHVALGLFVYTDIRIYFVYPAAEWQRTGLPLRLDDFGVANWTGLAATVLLVLLLLTSGDWAVRRYGARRWKSLQQLAYWAFALVVVHAVLYQRLDPHAEEPFVVALALIAVSVAVLQAAGYVKADRRILSKHRTWQHRVCSPDLPLDGRSRSRRKGHLSTTSSSFWRRWRC